MKRDTPVISLTRFRADLARSLTRRAERLVSSDNLAEQVPQLEPLEAYFIVKELGVDEALPILRHATPEQVQAFADLDCWRDGELAPEELDAWLAPFAARGPEILMEVFQALDYEVQVAFIASLVEIYDVRSEEAPEPALHVRRTTTVDQFLVLDEKPGEREIDAFFFVDALYRYDVQDAYRLLTAAKWELGSPLMEDAFRFRRARLLDMGFPERDEAMRIFTPPPAKPRPPLITRHTAPLTLPALYAAPLTEVSSLGRALGELDDAPLLAELERDLLMLVNMAVVAYGESPSDLAHVTRIAERVRDTVSLGLELLVRAEHPAVALESTEATRLGAALLRTWSLQDLFRRGHQEAAALQRAAAALAQDPVVAAWLTRVETEADDYSQDRADRAFLRTLIHERALYAGWDALQPDRKKAFGSAEELDAGQRRLDGVRGRLL